MNTPSIAMSGQESMALAQLYACGLVGVAATLLLLGRAAAAESPFKRTAWTAVAALNGAVAIWGAHLGAVESVTNQLAGVYDLKMTLVALLVAGVMCGVGAWLVEPSLKRGDVLSAALGGAAIGGAAAVSHFVGVSAIRVAGRVTIDQMSVAMAGAVAMAIGATACGVAARFSALAARCGAALLLGCAVVGFHLLAGDAVSITLNPRIATPASALMPDQLSIVVGALSVLALLAAVALAISEHRPRASVPSSRDRAFADLTREGIVICEEQKICDVNAAAARLVALDPNAMRGRAFRDFLDAPDPDRVLSASLAKPQEVGLKSTGGEPAWVEVSSRDVTVDGRLRRVFTLRDLSDQRHKEHQIRHLAYHDPLTGLANRAAFNEALAAALKRGGEVALFCVDLDKFKEVNDVYGHSAGDEMLRTVSRRIVAAAPGAMVFRLGGDEFVVIGTGPDAGDADKLAFRLTERLNTETVIASNTLRCGASVGYAIYPHHGADADQLFANADSALYRAKADGRGLARGFEPEMDLALRERRALQQDLATAISRNEMFLHWMPQAKADTGEIVGFEALVRWKHPTRGVVPPVQFIPVAEETAAIVPIGEWVLRTACHEAVRWTKAGKVAVNLSPVQFQHGDIVNLVHSILLETGLDARRLELEITEGVLLDDLSGALTTLRRLKALGVQIAMDDFGTGYSSLSYLQAFPFDRIKIDASFIRTLSTSPQAKAIVRAVIALGASLDMPITAEGVETAEQRTFLAELNCEEIQGYLVGRPSPVVSFESPFAKQRLGAVG